jgi:adenosylhomocysteine nucleosidase
MRARWGVVIALTSEAQQLFGRWRWRLEEVGLTCHESVNAGLELAIVQAGLGYKRAYSASHWLMTKEIAGLMALGISGGLDPSLKTGTLVVADNVLLLDSDRIAKVWHAEATVCQKAQDCLSAQGLITRIGTILTVPQPVLSVENKYALFHQSCALAADMESAAVALVASQNHLPFFGMRVVCDPAKQAVSQEISGLINSAGRVNILSLVSCLFRHPCLTAELFRLAKQYRTAMTAMRRGWQVLVKQGFSFL